MSSWSYSEASRGSTPTLAPSGVVGGPVPRALGELVRAEVRARGVVRLVVAVALDPACAHEERVVVAGVLARARHVIGHRRHTIDRCSGRRGPALILRRDQLGVESVLLALEPTEDIVLLLLRGLEVSAAEPWNAPRAFRSSAAASSSRAFRWSSRTVPRADSMAGRVHGEHRHHRSTRPLVRRESVNLCGPRSGPHAPRRRACSPGSGRSRRPAVATWTAPRCRRCRPDRRVLALRPLPDRCRRSAPAVRPTVRRRRRPTQRRREP